MPDLRELLFSRDHSRHLWQTARADNRNGVTESFEASNVSSVTASIGVRTPLYPPRRRMMRIVRYQTKRFNIIGRIKPTPMLVPRSNLMRKKALLNFAPKVMIGFLGIVIIGMCFSCFRSNSPVPPQHPQPTSSIYVNSAPAIPAESRTTVLQLSPAVPVVPSSALTCTGCFPNLADLLGPAPRLARQVFSVKDFGAVGDGITDDSNAFNATRAAACSAKGTFFVPPTSALYLIKNTIQITLADCSNTTFDFNHAPIRFAPIPGSWQGSVNDRLLYIESDYSAPRRITTSIAVGSTSLVAAAPEDTADLSPGDWLVVRQLDSAVGDIVSFDWMQVRSVSKNTVFVQVPFRVGFAVSDRWIPASHGTEFLKIKSLTSGVTIKNCNFSQPDAGQNNPTLHIGMALHTRVEDCLVDNVRGQALYVYQAKHIMIDNFRSVNGGTVTSEIAASVDVKVKNSTFGIARSAQAATTARTSPLTLDFGTAFFSVVENRLCAAGNIALQLLYGVHDGEIKENYFGWVRAAGITPIGILGRGTARLKIETNTFEGADPGGVAIDLSASGLATQLEEGHNVVGNNLFSGFTSNYGKPDKRDSYPAKEGTFLDSGTKMPLRLETAGASAQSIARSKQVEESARAECNSGAKRLMRDEPGDSN